MMSNRRSRYVPEGAVVHDLAGRRVGRIHDVKAEESNGELVVVEYLLGPAAVLERWGISLLRLVGLGAMREPIRIPWDRIDISDPERVTYLGRIEELPGHGR
jgi:sporulation protein YlmC with PRC-barrel domain